MSAVLIALLLPQAADLADRLKAGRWAAVEKADPKDKARLEELAKSEDKELQWWAGAALAEIDAREKAGAAYPEPIRVTHEAQNARASDVLREVLGRAGLKLSGDRIYRDPSITVSFKEMPFLQALREVCEPGQWLLSRTGSGEVRARPEGAPGSLSSCGTVLAVAVSQVNRTTEVTFEKEPYTHFNVVLMLHVDPRLKFLHDNSGWQLVSAVDDAGTSLKPETPERESAVSTRHLGGSHGAGRLYVQLLDPAPTAKRIAHLRGVLDVTLALKTEQVVFKNVLSGEVQTREAGPIKAALKSCGPAARGYEVVLELSTGLPREQWAAPEHGEILLTDAEGTALFARGSSRSGTFYKMNYEQRGAAAVGAPERLTFPVVTAVYRRRVCFEVRDIPLNR